MTVTNRGTAPASLERVKQLLGEYGAPEASASYLLCDRHPPELTAYTLIASDLTASSITYGELREESEKLAAAFYAIGFRAGDRIATLMGKSRSFLVTLQAIWRLGAVHVPLFTAFAPPAIEMRLEASGSRLVVCDEDQRSKLQGFPCRVITTGDTTSEAESFRILVETNYPKIERATLGGNAPLIQIYTSGTTGTPKGVIVPQRALASFYAYMEFGLGLNPDDVFWNGADPGWAYGLYYGVIGTFLTGVKSVMYQGNFSAEATFYIFSKFKVTNFAAAPTVYRSLRASSAPVPAGISLRCASSAGEPLTPEVNEWASANLGVEVHDHYGQTETGMTICNLQYTPLSRNLKDGSMGCELPGWSAKVVSTENLEALDEGELGCVAIDLHHSPLAWFDGYVNEPAKTAEKFSEDGRWYLTGDLARTDSEGDFFFASRDDDIIIMAGYRIGPFEIESVLASHPSIIECAVVAVPDEIRGEVLVAAVVLRSGTPSSESLTATLQDWVKKKYAAHAYPRRIHYLESLPKTPSGKVQRYVVRNQLAAQHYKERQIAGEL
ncbi:AMP-binding protein [Microbulbifer sp. SH-1]|uniref:AMP-binding protein n=1 Tax=Microbulbifer sp. SH-1 TaxID=2681547 RepID=UPI001408C752|nr:AMP-binding protein [Microbulbifer sp. SH-1]QIL91256.1 AMP-binding protein [Microbulbifer sp. SH-1]